MMMSEFTMSIRLGNAAMSERTEVAEALETAARRLRAGADEGRAKDLNGNTVGEWSVDWPPDPHCPECGLNVEYDGHQPSCETGQRAEDACRWAQTLHGDHVHIAISDVGDSFAGSEDGG